MKKNLLTFALAAMTVMGAATTSDTATPVHKVLRNGQILIIRAGKTYTLTGTEVK